MQINEKTYEIVISQYDYGIPIGFKAGVEEGFTVGDIITFVFGGDTLANKSYEVNSEDFEFSFYFTKGEALALFNKPVQRMRYLPYSVKREARDGEYLETLVESRIICEHTIKLEVSDDPDDFYGEPTGDIEIFANGVYKIKPYATATVSIPLPTGKVILTTSGTHNVYDFAEAEVTIPYQAKGADCSTEQQVIEPDEPYEALSQVTIKGAVLQNKAITPTITQQTVRADEGYVGLGTVTVEATEQNVDIDDESFLSYIGGDDGGFYLSSEASDANMVLMGFNNECLYAIGGGNT